MTEAALGALGEPGAHDELDRLAEEIARCRRCPRLTVYRAQVAANPRRAYQGETYWARPVPGFGDPAARLLIVGLAPAAHGANRTGRMFTGDSSADWLIRALHRAGFANQPTSRCRDDGLRLTDCYITAACRCAPPENRPTAGELAACRPFLARELALLRRVRVVVALGRIAFDAYLRVVREAGGSWPDGARRKPPFAHGRIYRWDDGRPALVASYHPSRQNTNTGVLTEAMLDEVFAKARRLLDE